MVNTTLSSQYIYEITGKRLSFQKFKQVILQDYRIAIESRTASLLGRREVLTGKAKFGILGDGKELPQIVLAKNFKKGDWRSGYYRDQTLMLALKTVTISQLFAQLYANPSLKEEPHSGGRQMNAHFATRLLDEQGMWKNQTRIYNTSADISCTSGQMPRALGLALASKKYRKIKGLDTDNQFSTNGNEVTFVTIGDASTSEGPFWEVLNAAGVQRVPLAIFVWDDGYGISVPKKFQTTKQSISKILAGFQYDEQTGEGIRIYDVEGWNYEKMCRVFRAGIDKVRAEHVPAVFHIQELTQPQGHSTSGSHQRYKSKQRLDWEKEMDCNVQFHDWIVEKGIAEAEELALLKEETEISVKKAMQQSWKSYNAPIKDKRKALNGIFSTLLESGTAKRSDILNARKELSNLHNPTLRELAELAHHVLKILRFAPPTITEELAKWYREFEQVQYNNYGTYLYSQSAASPLNVDEIKPIYSDKSPYVNGFQVLNHCFDKAFEREVKLVAFGEDLGKIGDVNQGFSGLQEKYGSDRIYDTGIREVSIIGQGIGMAIRGLRPIAEIQYLDYFIFGLQPISDDLATLHYRTRGGQKAPLIVRTRGHRLEGIWHTGSPIGMILNSVRGVHLLVPRNMTQAAGFYNTLLQSDDPAIVIECLNGYRLKEMLPDNVGEFTVPLGVPDIIRPGTDISIVTYGSCCLIAQKAATQLAEIGIDCEVIDVQSLLPFDIHHRIVESLRKTNRILFLDEDVPGGASAYLFQQVMEIQQGYQHLDSPPATLTAAPHRSAYGSDGDYYCKPSVEAVFDKVYEIMHEVAPADFPLFYKK